MTAEADFVAGIENPEARRQLSEYDAYLAAMQQHMGGTESDGLPRARTIAGEMGHPGLVTAVQNFLDTVGGWTHDELARKRLDLRQIADMQRAEERQARETAEGEQG